MSHFNTIILGVFKLNAVKLSDVISNILSVSMLGAVFIFFTKCHCAGNSIFIVMLSVLKLNAVMLSVAF